ncbi:hypothetical protein MBLNU13_g04753t2 [Cladosporium sp. NU13]
MAPNNIQTYNRPSKLLNLNLSPKWNKKISASNAAHSPFLLLPPEVRGLIYDHAFNGTAVHISEDDRSQWTGKIGYRLDVCLCAPDYGPRQRIIQLPPRENPQDSAPRYTQHDHCTDEISRVSATRVRVFPLQILRVCRQIHYEAALKPFSQTTFVIQERS